MLLGTHSNAGKSLLTTAFCRILARRGVRVAPFKAQNMSNNAGVARAHDGGYGEMGRAQITQAEAAGVDSHTDMNPVLLKPEADRRSQVVLNGRAVGHIEAANWLDIKRMLWDEVRAAYDRLAARFDVVVLEGAGSPAEINLKAGDIVNLRMARHANAPCLLIGDIDRGGVFAALAGTLLLLEPDERAQVHGFLINKFRGDPALLGNVTDILRDKAFGTPTLGVIPFVPDLQIAEEDAVAIEKVSRPTPSISLPSPRPLLSSSSSEQTERGTGGEVEVDIAAIYLPHISNFDEFDALAAEPGVRLRYVRDANALNNNALGQPHAVLLPGSKVTISDLAWLRARNLDRAILAAHERGAHVVGICGGYQMLGQSLIDPHGVEGPVGAQSPGLGLLPVATEFCRKKQTHRAQLRLHNEFFSGDPVDGYEIHTGDTQRLDGAAPLGDIIRRGEQTVSLADGAQSSDCRVWGTYLHGIFENDDFRRAWLRSLGWSGHKSALSAKALRQREYDRLADAVEEHVNWEEIERLIWR